MDPIHAFLSSSGRKQLLIVKSHHKLVVKNKNQVGFFTRLLAKLGMGNASLKNISQYVISHPGQLDSGTEVRFNRYLKSYNQNTHLFWKKAKYVPIKGAPVSPDPLSVDYRAEALFVKCLHHYKQQDIEALAKTIKNLRKALLLLDPKDKKGNKALFNDILKFKKKVKQHVDNDSLKKLQATVLKIHFSNRLLHLDAQLKLLENKCEELGEEDFIKSQLEVWRKKINQGKPISIPKWYHCTKSPNIIGKILQSAIHYSHQGAFPGAFVANYPATGFGSFGIAMSENIEKTATSRGKLLPKSSNFSNKVNYGVISPSDSIVQNQIWLGFQSRRGIPIRHPKKNNDLLKYYKDNTLFSIFYDNNQSSLHIDAMKALAKKHKIQVLSLKEANTLRLFIDSTFNLSLPPAWKGKIQHF